MTRDSADRPRLPLADDALVRLLGAQAFDREAVEEAARDAGDVLPRAAQQALAETGLGGLGEAVLLEGQFGRDHFTLTPSRRVYYRIRPLLPAKARGLLRRGVVSRAGVNGPLSWPIEDRFVTFVERVREALAAAGPATPLPWWPSGHRLAVVLTHDVEGPFGIEHLDEVLALERARGFRSVVSFVGGAYSVPEALLEDLRASGMEIGLHGWRHDGMLFSSRRRFQSRLPNMNRQLRAWGATGFRSPMTHRQPAWMQDLEVEWDSSFFDTDPFEPMPGGVMSIWPYVMGRFVELPYTLPQDHTLIETLGEKGPVIWLEKLDFIAAHEGMALLNSHSDYLAKGRLGLYEEFLDELARRNDVWQALPREVAAWTAARWDGKVAEEAPGGGSADQGAEG